MNYRPDAAASAREAEYALRYQVTNLAFGDHPDDPSAEPTWLLLPQPVPVPIGDPQTTTIPIVVRQFPTPPTLLRQSYAPYAAAGDTAFADQLSWNYEYRIQLSPDAADTVTTTVRFNNAPSVPRLVAPEAAPLLGLADAAVRFQQGYALLAPQLASVVQAAAGGDPVTVARAKAVLAGLVDLIAQVVSNGTWGSGAADPAMGSSVTVQPRVDAYTVELAPAENGAWQMMVSVAPGGTGSIASLAPAPLTITGDPQPGTSAPVYTDTSVTVAYTPADPQAPLIAQIAIDQLPVLTQQSAWAGVKLARNADLMSGFTTEPAFVYQTPDTAFPDEVTPFLQGPWSGFDIAQLTGMPSGTLAEYLTSLLELMFVPGGAAPNNNPLLAATLGYARPVFTGTTAGTPQTASSVFPVAMTATETLACTGPAGDGQIALADFAAGLAGRFTEWTSANPVDTASGRLVLAFTLFANTGGAAAALATLPNLTLALSQVADVHGR